jgi:hypothetical protein
MFGTLSDFVERNANAWARQHDVGEWSTTVTIFCIDLALAALIFATVYMNGKFAQRGRMASVVASVGAAIALLVVAAAGVVVAWIAILTWDKVTSNGISAWSFTNIAFRIVFIASAFPPVAAVAILGAGVRALLGKKD